MNKSHAAFLMSSKRMKASRRYYWTVTASNLLAVDETRHRWNHLLTLLAREYPHLRGLRVFELHLEHGLHVHLETNQWLDVGRVRQLAERAGWGRIHVVRRPEWYARYIAKTLSQPRPKCLSGWRLWAPFGKWSATKVRDVIHDTLFTRTYRAVKQWLGWTGNQGFFDRMRFVRRIIRATVENDWPDARGPDGRPYSDFDLYDPASEFTQAIWRVPA